MANGPNPPVVSGLGDLAPIFRSILCDVWGVVHNGVATYRDATDALTRFRDGGGRVVLVTNAPRPASVVVEMIDRLGVPRTAYDSVVTSGDTARAYLTGHPGTRIYHIGPERDLPIYFGLDVEFGDEDDCELITCTGLFDDERETPDDYLDSFERLRARGVPMLCINPDIVVERGDRLIWCAGALAERYREGNGEAIIMGKPYAPIYQAALDELTRLAGCVVERGDVLAIGDGLDTDIRGAFGQGIDAVFITGGIHAMVFGERDRPDIAAVHALLATGGLGARALMTRLVWEGDAVRTA